jgi:hypothetical protein
MRKEIKGGGRPLCLPQRVLKQSDCKRYFVTAAKFDSAAYIRRELVGLIGGYEQGLCSFRTPRAAAVAY